MVEELCNRNPNTMTPSPNTDPAPEPAPEKSATPRFIADPDSGYMLDRETKRWIEDDDETVALLNALNDGRDQARAELKKAKKWMNGVHDVEDVGAADVACRIQFHDGDPIDVGEAFIDVKCWELAPDQSGTRYADVKQADQARAKIKALRTELEKALRSFEQLSGYSGSVRIMVAGDIADIKQALASTQEDAP